MSNFTGKTPRAWRARITDNPQDGPGHPDMGWDKVDAIHKNIIKRFIEQDDMVLDAGCGVGRIADWFDHYIGIDFVPEFILKSLEICPGKIFVLADFNKSLPFTDKAFEWAIMISASQYVGDFKEIKRVAKKVLELSYGDPENYTIHE